MGFEVFLKIQIFGNFCKVLLTLILKFKLSLFIILYQYHGRLILDADTIPTVIPFVHTGMQEIMPIGAKIPKIGKTVGLPNSRVLVKFFLLISLALFHAHTRTYVFRMICFTFLKYPCGCYMETSGDNYYWGPH